MGIKTARAVMAAPGGVTVVQLSAAGSDDRIDGGFWRCGPADSMRQSFAGGFYGISQVLGCLVTCVSQYCKR
jgi:hypothetical protein